MARAKHAEDARKGALTRLANLRARRAEELAQRAASPSDAPPAVPDDLAGVNAEVYGVPVPSTNLGDYLTGGEAERQLSFHRHFAALRAAIDLDERRGRLFSREVIAEREADYDQELLSCFATLPEAVAIAVSPELKAAVRIAARTWAMETRKRLADFFLARIEAARRIEP